MVFARRLHSSSRKMSNLAQEESPVALELQKIGSIKSLSQGRKLHGDLVKQGQLERDPSLLNHVAEMYANCDSLDEARSAFELLYRPVCSTWIALIAANARNGQLQEAKRLYDEIPNKAMLTTTAMLAAYAKAGCETEARSLFEGMPMKGVPAWNAIISMYAEKGKFAEAKSVYDRMPRPNVVSKNVMITGYGHFGRLDEARKIFDGMQLQQRSVVTWNAMITAYCQNCCLQSARELFDQMLEKNTISWNTMITGYSQNGHPEQALQLFIRMDLEGIEANRFTFCSALDACASLSYVAEGRMIHEDIEATGTEDIAIQNSLANMYGKCGKLELARRVFEKIAYPDVVSWTGMVAAYAQNGFSPQALKTFRAMVQHGVQPNDVTIINTLAACSHGGLFEAGMEIFSTLTAGEYGRATPTRDHFMCMIDMLGRAGNLEGAEGLLKRMPYEAGEIAWTSLLSACRTHRDSARAARVAMELSTEGRKDSSPYVILSNIYKEK